MSSNLTLEEREIKERIERIIEIFNYKYAKANTKSKKELISGDLISLSRICEEHFSNFNLTLSWDKDDELYRGTILSCYKFIENIIINKDKYFKIFNTTVKSILSTKPNIYKYYGKEYQRKKAKELDEIFCTFLSNFDKDVYKEYINMIDRQNIFCAPLEGYNGQNYPFSILNTNVIFIDNRIEENIEFYKILSHELGHAYEAKLYLNNGRIRGYDNTFNNPFYEVPSSFMEYAYINYLLENNIYKEEANMLFYYYTIELLINSIYADIICRISSIEDNLDNQLNVNIEDFNNYIETIKRNYNLHDIPTNNKVSLRDPFIYGFGQLFSIYMYENYKKDPNYFKKELKVSLLEYSSSNDISSFERLGVTSDNLVNSDILKRVLTKNS